MAEHARRSDRRVPAPPPALAAELVRSRLLDRISRRFEVPITVVVGGAGFGKSTVLAQAIRANQADPRGVDAWLSCEPGDGDAASLADALVDAIGHGSERGEPVERVIDALAQAAPIDVCVVIDEIQEISRRSSASALLGELVKRLPPHAHLVLAGRNPPPVALAHRRAAGEVVDIDAHELAFTPTEVAAVARLVGRDADTVSVLDRLAGWPSLVRLALSAPEGAAPQFLWEEVVAALTPAEQRSLLALATLGWGTVDDVATVAGGDNPVVDLDALTRSVPLLVAGADGEFGVHRLWEFAIERIFPADDHRQPRLRALELFHRRGETVRAGWRARRWRDTAALLRASRALVRDTIGSLPVDTATQWLEAIPPMARTSLDYRLLGLALRHANRYDDPGLDAAVANLAAEFVSAGDNDGAAVALALATIIAHMRGDLASLLAVAGRAAVLPSAGDEPMLRFLGGIVEAATASLEGDPAAAVRAIEALSLDGVPGVFTDLVLRLQVNMLCLCGRAAEAVPIADRLLASDSAYVRTIPASIRWLAGDPSGFPGGRVDPDVPAGTNDRYRLYHASYAMAVAASFGDRDTVAAVRPVLESASALDVRDRVLFAVAIALGHVADHDEPTATAVIRSHVDVTLGDRVADGRLRRLLAVAYVCDERVRQRWRGVDLGPSLERQRDVAETLLAARAGTLVDDHPLPDAASVLTTLPLVWSAELAAHAVSAGCSTAFTLAAGLAELAGTRLRRELEQAAMADDRRLAIGATRLLEVVADDEQPPVRIGVLGPLTIEGADAGRAGGPAAHVRRRRVRTLVELLVLVGPMSRDRIAALIWPELDPDAASGNVRVTLSRLRAALAPASERRCPALQIDHDTVALAPAFVEVDWWQFAADVASADEAERMGDTTATIAALERGCRRWRGEPFADVDPDAELTAAVEEARQMLVDAALRLGEHLLVAGRFDDAAGWAERVVRESPYTERAHRLAIAAQLQRRDRHAIAHAVAAMQSMLDELGVDPEPPTAMLLRQAAARLGTLDDATRRPAVRAS
jgi:LuxR family maltose regulon positive regulatory protein